jgi:hypothetical protein
MLMIEGWNAPGKPSIVAALTVRPVFWQYDCVFWVDSARVAYQ